MQFAAAGEDEDDGRKGGRRRSLVVRILIGSELSGSDAKEMAWLVWAKTTEAAAPAT